MRNKHYQSFPKNLWKLNIKNIQKYHKQSISQRTEKAIIKPSHEKKS